MAEGGHFFESPRWHDGRWWVSDFYAEAVYTVGPDGGLEEVLHVDGQASGTGWLPDGSLLAVSMRHHKLIRRAPDGSVSEHADVSEHCGGLLNDMVVDPAGRAYVGNFGFDLMHGADPEYATLVRVDPDGTASVAAEELMFPNGSVIDGDMLIVAETMGARFTAFTIAEDGTLHGRREYARVEGAVPDGICLDAEGAIWFADPISGDLIRVRPGGEVTDRVSMGERLKAYACMLGGPDRRTLFGAVSSHHNRERTLRDRAGRIVALDVDVAGAGLP
jgi:sugar lactone lactonase YvrE